MGVSVFTGPSLPPAEARRLLPEAEVLPPAARGDLYAARKRGAHLVLVIDGTFSHRLAISPREVVDVLADGARVLGASSMGAIRAAECWPAGMRGVGAVYRLYRAGLLSSDDAVAVATDPDNDYAAVSVALVNVYGATRRAGRRGLVDRSAARRIEEAATGLFFAQRTWRAILREAAVADRDGSLRVFCERVDLKRVDAVRAVRELARIAVAEPVGQASSASFERPARYPGHDPLLGWDPDEIGPALTRWLFGSGRYQRYLWPLVVDEPEFHGLDHEPDRPTALRERLAVTLARLLDEPAAIAARLTAELEFLEEFETELMRWHAVQKVAAVKAGRGVRSRPNLLTATREAVAIAHGYDQWRSLTADLVDGRLFGAIPVAWVEQACAQLALARS
ncbi:MAG TPA: TfuA-like protein [Planosporangium sp.]|jgi:hypothetical protein|nr:TfuA-like protein [Planosporangium sp.]